MIVKVGEMVRVIVKVGEMVRVIVRVDIAGIVVGGGIAGV